MVYVIFSTGELHEKDLIEHISGKQHHLLFTMAKVGGAVSVVKVSHKFEHPKFTPTTLTFREFCRLLL